MYLALITRVVANEYFPSKPRFVGISIDYKSRDITCSTKKKTCVFLQEDDLVMLRLADIKYQAVGGFSPKKAVLIRKMLRQLEEDSSVLLSSHNQELATALEQIADLEQQAKSTLDLLNSIYASAYSVVESFPTATKPNMTLAICTKFHFDVLRSALTQSGSAIVTEHKRKIIIEIRNILKAYKLIEG
jgi:hypothetical protein